MDGKASAITRIAPWLDRFGRWFRDACAILVVALLLAYGVELLARRGIIIPDYDEYLLDHPVLTHQTWGAQYIADVRAFHWVRLYKDYVGFREAPYKSATVNIDKDGLRTTVGNCERPDAKAIYVFGGSTMLGVGVPDPYTIPAYLARQFNGEGNCVKIINFGGGWWQSSQALAQFTVLLREGGRPVAALFYDGINDIDAVSYGGKVGGRDPSAEVRFNHSAELRDDRISLRQFLLSNSKALTAFERMMSPPPVKGKGNPFRLTPQQIQMVAPQIVAAYETNVRMTMAIAEQFNVPVFFFLQPFPLISPKPLTAGEATLRKWRIEDRDWEPTIVSKTYEIWRNSPYLKSLPRFFDVSTALDRLNDEVFVDVEHLLPNGNEIMAKIMAEKLRTVPALGGKI